MKRRSIILVAVLTASAVLGAAFGAAAAITGRDDADVPAALNDPSLAPAQTARSVLRLRSTVGRGRLTLLGVPGRAGRSWVARHNSCPPSEASAIPSTRFPPTRGSTASRFERREHAANWAR